MIKLLAFDMDGTIYSSETVLEPAYDAAVREFNQRYNRSLRTPTCHEILKLVGLNPVKIYATLFPELEPHLLNELGVLILDRLCARIRSHGGIILGNAETFLPRFHRRFRLRIVSNGRAEYLTAILEGFKFTNYFEPLRSVNGLESKAQLLKRVMELEKVTAAETIMIGDRQNDKEAARANGVCFVGCKFGHSDPAELEGSDLIISNYQELSDWIDQQ